MYTVVCNMLYRTFYCTETSKVAYYFTLTFLPPLQMCCTLLQTVIYTEMCPVFFTIQFTALYTILCPVMYIILYAVM